jgi:hypothetical protein
MIGCSAAYFSVTDEIRLLKNVSISGSSASSRARPRRFSCEGTYHCVMGCLLRFEDTPVRTAIFRQLTEISGAQFGGPLGLKSLRSILTDAPVLEPPTTSLTTNRSVVVASCLTSSGVGQGFHRCGGMFTHIWRTTSLPSFASL